MSNEDKLRRELTKRAGWDSDLHTYSFDLTAEQADYLISAIASEPRSTEDKLRRALEPFANEAKNWSPTNGWSKDDPMLDTCRISGNTELTVADLRLAREALAATQEQRGEWQPIESAPKDGTRILASDGQVIEVIFWAAGWFNQSAEISTWRVWPPTHWQPLPSPPAVTSSKSDAQTEKQRGVSEEEIARAIHNVTVRNGELGVPWNETSRPQAPVRDARLTQARAVLALLNEQHKCDFPDCDCAVPADMLAILQKIRNSYPGYIPDFIEAVDAVIANATGNSIAPIAGQSHATTENQR